jgi:hypothetical protein
MQSTQPFPTVEPALTSRIIAQWDLGNLHEKSYVTHRIICGQAMQEACESIRNSHRENFKNDGDVIEGRISDLLSNAFPMIPRPSAYRLMTAAARVMAILTETHHTHPVVWLELGGERYYASTVLTMPPAEAKPEIITFQQTFQHFLADKTLAEVTRCALNGCDAAHNISKADTGRKTGGKGGDRRAYAQFIACHFKEMAGIFKKWDTLLQKDPAEFSRMTESIRACFLGGPVKIGAKGRPADMQPLPKSAAELMLGVLKERLKSD